jgi:hypothetical protein
VISAVLAHTRLIVGVFVTRMVLFGLMELGSKASADGCGPTQEAAGAVVSVSGDSARGVETDRPSGKPRPARS